MKAGTGGMIFMGNIAQSVIRRLLTALSLAMITFISGCSSQESVTLSAENIFFDHLKGDLSTGIFVISDERKGPVWYKTRKKLRLEALKNIPDTSFQNVWQIKISLEDGFIAVLSEGEGHPVVEVFRLGDILSHRDGWEDEPVGAILSIDPYPGTIRIKGWKSDTLLSIYSDVLLTEMDKKERRVPSQDPSNKTREFIWDVLTDTITMK
jgi:hypothetical protein